MKIITYQHKVVVDTLINKGEYKVIDKSQMKTLNSHKDIFGVSTFDETYEYIFNRMNKKIKDKSDYDKDIIAPIWGWYKYPDINELDNDNKSLYRITLEIDDNKILLSDFDYYENFAIAGLSFVLYGKDEIIEEIYDKSKVEGKEIIYKYYDKMINKNHLRHAAYIQATFYKIRYKDVISIEKVDVKNDKNDEK